MRQIFFIILIQLTLKATSAILQDRLYNAAGGKHEFLMDLVRISDRASALRGGIENIVGEIRQGGSALIQRLDFDDGVRWAAKMSQNKFLPEMRYARSSLNGIQRYCPNIPAPRFQGEIETLANSSLIYYITDWIDGTELFEKLRYEELQFDERFLNSEGNESIHINVTLSNKLITQLAEFAYNLTACPIPKYEGKSLFLNY